MQTQFLSSGMRLDAGVSGGLVGVNGAGGGGEVGGGGVRSDR